MTPAELVTAIVTEAGVLEAPYGESIARGGGGGVSADDLRTAVVEAAREMLRLGLVAGTSGNASARNGDEVLITPAGLPYERMTEDDLVTIGMDGEAAEGQREPSSERRVHLADLRARPDVGAVVHTHSVHATAWSFTGEPLDTGTEELEAAAGGEVLTARFAPDGIGRDRDRGGGRAGRPARGAAGAARRGGRR